MKFERGLTNSYFHSTTCRLTTRPSRSRQLPQRQKFRPETKIKIKHACTNIHMNTIIFYLLVSPGVDYRGTQNLRICDFKNYHTTSNIMLFQGGCFIAHGIEQIIKPGQASTTTHNPSSYEHFFFFFLPRQSSSQKPQTYLHRPPDPGAEVVIPALHVKFLNSNKRKKTKDHLLLRSHRARIFTS